MKSTIEETIVRPARSAMRPEKNCRAAGMCEYIADPYCPFMRSSALIYFVRTSAARRRFRARPHAIEEELERHKHKQNLIRQIGRISNAFNSFEGRATVSDPEPEHFKSLSGGNGPESCYPELQGGKNRRVRIDWTLFKIPITTLWSLRMTKTGTAIGCRCAPETENKTR